MENGQRRNRVIENKFFIAALNRATIESINNTKKVKFNRNKKSNNKKGKYFFYFKFLRILFASPCYSVRE